MDEQKLARAIRDLAEDVHRLHGLTVLLLALRLKADGHAATMGEAIRIAEDPARVVLLYPLED